MSKKMLKRSLALGALMAFVITGSAMAQVVDTKYVHFKGVQGTVTNNEMDTVKDYITGYGERVLGGYRLLEEADVSNAIDTNVTVNGGSFNMVVGGNYSDETPIMSVNSTNVVIDGATVKQLIGGTGFSGIDASDDAEGRTTNVTILSGNFGGAIDNTDCAEMHVAGGDLLKTGSGKQNLSSTIEETNVTINGGTFNAAIYGGSLAIRNYAGYESGKIESSVEKANVKINGGTFNDAIVAGGLAWSFETKSTVGEATVNISGVNGNLKFGDKADIYAGGMIDGHNYNKNNEAALVSEASINIESAVVNNIYGTGGYITPTSAGKGYVMSHNGEVYGNERDWLYSQTRTYKDDKGNTVTQKGQTVNTNLSLSNVTANTIDLPKGTLTLAGTNKVNNMTIGEGVTSINIASKNLADGYSLQGNGNDSKLTVTGAKKLTITGIQAGTYDIIGEFGTVTGVEENINFDQTDSLLDAKAIYEGDIYKVEVTAKSGSDIADNLDVSENTGNFVENIITGGNNEAKNFLDKLTDPTVSKDVVKDTLNAVQKMGEAGGNSATAASIVKNVTGVTNDRLSFNCGHSAPHKGGHGVGLFEEGSGADIWVEYVHGKDEVEDMPSTAGASSYEGQYNGIVMGVDFKKVGKFQSGIAFNYGEGDTNSVGSAVRTHSDYDFWGVGYYGNIHNDDSNIIFDINYAQTESDVTQSSGAGTLEANPETTTWSAGVKLEKLYQNENVQIVPYTGLRYMSIDSDDYATKGGGFMYNMERQNIWMLPVGVSIRQEIQNDNGWTVSPRVDLSYIWAFGDTNSNMEVKVGNGITPIGYDVMDDGSFLGLVGIEAHKGQWGYGIAYSYQKGDHSESKKWYVDVNYSF